MYHCCITLVAWKQKAVHGMIIVNHFLHTQKLSQKKVLRNYLNPLFHVWLRAFEKRVKMARNPSPRRDKALLTLMTGILVFFLCCRCCSQSAQLFWITLFKIYFECILQPSLYRTVSCLKWSSMPGGERGLKF